jgi:hypothetical protein
VVSREVFAPASLAVGGCSCESAGAPQLSCHLRAAEVAGDGCVRDLVVASERAEAFSGCAAAD